MLTETHLREVKENSSKTSAGNKNKKKKKAVSYDCVRVVASERGFGLAGMRKRRNQELLKAEFGTQHR